MISALHEGAWTVDEVRFTLQDLFDRQYSLTEEVVTERRYYIETDTWVDGQCRGCIHLTNKIKEQMKMEKNQKQK